MGFRRGRNHIWLGHQEALHGRNSIWNGFSGRGFLKSKKDRHKVSLCQGREAPGTMFLCGEQELTLPQRDTNLEREELGC